MLTDPLADLLTRIRNASRVRHKSVSMPYSRLKQAIVKILKTEGFLLDYEVVGKAPKKELKLNLKYYRRYPAIDQLKRVSKPGVRRYADKKALPQLMRGPGIIILSTSQGVMTGRQALKKGIGGEIICKIS
jgi:small subunit ribosomal protein S8